MESDKFAHVPEYWEVEQWHLIDKIKIREWINDMLATKTKVKHSSL